MNCAHALLPLLERQAVSNTSDPWDCSFWRIYIWKGYSTILAMNALSLGVDTQTLRGLYLPPTPFSTRYHSA